MAELLSIILAAGEGTRMRSATPKVMHPVGGLPMIWHVMGAAAAGGSTTMVAVVGPDQDALGQAIRAWGPGTDVVVQAGRLGTAHAVLQAQPFFADATGNVLVLYGDTPLVTPETLDAVVDRLDAGANLVVVGFEPENPRGYGRLLTLGDALLAIREDRDATDDERAVQLCNSGIMGFRAETLRALIGRIGNSNAKGEYYLTDAVELANADDLRVEYVTADAAEMIGVDDRAKLADAERTFQERRRRAVLERGVTLRDPSSTYFSWDTEIAEDVTVEPHVVFGPGVKIDRGAVVHAFSHLEGAHVGPGATVGPFARLRPGADLAEKAKVGNFVEVKNARVGQGAKVSHLTYVGDADVGAKANIGAGTVTVNYDGINKHRTVIGEGAFIGSNSSLIAPVTIGANGFVTSGSVITEDVEPDAAAFGRARQENKPGYATRIRERAEAIKRAKAAKDKSAEE